MVKEGKSPKGAKEGKVLSTIKTKCISSDS
jgi:hypothetical protein